MRQGVPEGCSSQGYASFKQVKPGPWHKKVIPGDSGERQTDRQTDRQTETERDRHRERKRKGTQNSELYYTRIKILGSCLFLQSVPANLHASRLHIKQ